MRAGVRRGPVELRLQRVGCGTSGRGEIQKNRDGEFFDDTALLKKIFFVIIRKKTSAPNLLFLE